MSYIDTLGYEANNWGNIKFVAANDWKGQTGYVESGSGIKYAEFEKPEDGIRAIFKILDTYNDKYNLRTINKIINRYAPPVEGNNTEIYQKNVSEFSGIGRTETFSVRKDAEKAKELVKAIIKQEISYDAPDDVINKGYSMAFGTSSLEDLSVKRESMDDKTKKIIVASLLITILIIALLS